MQVTETLNEGLTRAYDITITAAELESKVTEKLEAARADFQMKGFRKGHAPLALMKKMFGQSVLGEAPLSRRMLSLRPFSNPTLFDPIQQLP